MKIMGTNISMVRGDSESITVTLQADTKVPIPFGEGDVLYFTVKEHVNTINKKMQKIVDVFNEDGQAIIEILPEDTKDWRFRDYVYDIQMNRADGSITTIIPTSKFVVESEVTYE